MSGVTVDTAGILAIDASTLTVADAMNIDGTVPIWLSGSMVALAGTTVNLNGAGTIELASGESAIGDSGYTSGAFVFGKNLTVKTASSSAYYTPTIYADVTNNGTILSDGRQLNITGKSPEKQLNFVNNGIVTLGAKSQELNFTNAAVDNTHGLIFGSNGTINFTGSSLRGGLLGGDAIRFTGANTVSGVTLSSTAIATVASGTMTVDGDITLNGKLRMDYGAAIVNADLENPAVLNGYGVIELFAETTIGDSAYTTGAFVFGKNLTVKTASSSAYNIPVIYADVTNNGTIRADGRWLNLIGQSAEKRLELINNGLIEAGNGGLTLTRVNVDNAAGVISGSGAQLQFGTDTVVTAGTLTGSNLRVTGATQMSDVTVDAAGILAIDASTLTVADAMTIDGKLLLSLGGSMVALAGTTVNLNGAGTIELASGESAIGDAKYLSGAFVFGKNLTVKTASSSAYSTPVIYADVTNNGTILSDGRQLNITGAGAEKLLNFNNSGNVSAVTGAIVFTRVALGNSGGTLNGGSAGIAINAGNLTGSGMTLTGKLTFAADSAVVIGQARLDHAEITFAGTAVMTDLTVAGGSIYSGGNLTINGAALTGNAVIGNAAGSALSLSGLSGVYTLNLNGASGAAVTVTGNDFSHAAIAVGGSYSIDLSGNYWNGMTDISAIRAAWNLGNNVTINSVLTDPIGGMYVLGDNLNHSYLINGENLNIVFSRELNAASVAGNLALIDSVTGKAVALSSGDWQVSGSTLTVQSSAFAAERHYSLRLGGGITDLSGQQLSAADTAAREVVIDRTSCSVAMMNPAATFSVGKGGWSELTLFFSGNIDPESLKTGLTITNPDGAAVAPAAIETLSPNTVKITLPAQTAAGNYRVTVSTAVTDYAKNPLAAAWQETIELQNVNLAVRNASAPAAAAAGDAITVSWETFNSTGAAFSGGWSDAVYLSQDDRWDIGDIRLGTVRHDGIAAGEPLKSSLAVTPGVKEGNYYLLVRADAAGEIGGASGGTAAKPLTLTVTDLGGGAAVTGQETTRYYKLTQAANSTLNLNFTTDGKCASLSDLYVAYGRTPTADSYDLSIRNLTSAGGTLNLAAGASDRVVYLMVHTTAAAAITTNVAAEAVPLSISAVLGGEQSRGTASTIVLTGVDFTPGMTVSLIDDSGVAHALNEVAFVSSSKVIAAIPANTFAAGNYSVMVNDGSEQATLADAVVLTESSEIEYKIDLDVPSRLGFHLLATIPLTVTATGSGSAPGALIVVVPYIASTTVSGETVLTTGGILTTDAAKVDQGFWTSTMPEGFSNAIMLLGSGGQAGSISAGETISTDIYYTGWVKPWDTANYPPIQWSCAVITEDNPTALDWDKLYSGLDLDPALSRLLSSTASVSIGGTLGDYVATLNRTARQLEAAGATGEQLTAESLTGCKLCGAFGISAPLTTLETVQSSASVEVGKLSVGLTRSCRSDLISRFETGSFGYNWSCSLDIALTVSAAGDITVNFGGIARTYQQSFSGSYLGTTADGSQLTRSRGNYLLTESDGTVYTFSAAGTLLTIADTNGNTVTCSYSSGLLTMLSGSNDSRMLITRDAAGRIVRVEDSAGAWSEYSYDAAGDLVSAADHTGLTVAYTYDGTHALLSSESSSGRSAAYGYDQATKLLSVMTVNGQTTTLARQEDGSVSVTDSYGNRNDYFFNADGRVFKVIEVSTGTVLTYTYDSFGNITELTNSRRGTVSATYDGNGRLLTYTDNSNHTAVYTYNAAGDVSSICDARGNTETISYDADRNVIGGRFSNGASVSYVYDFAAGTVRVVGADGAAIDYKFNTDGSPVAITVGGKTTTFTYDNAGNLTGVVRPDNSTLAYAYDISDRLMLITDPNGNDTGYTWNSIGKLESAVRVDGSLESFTYDADGNLTGAVSRSGATAEYLRNTFGDLTSVRYSDGRAYSFSYDAKGRVATAGNITFDWHAGGGLNSIVWNDGRSVVCGFDAGDTVLKSVTVNGLTIALTYTEYGDTDTVTAGNFALDCNYGFWGELSQVVRGDGVTIGYQHNANLMVTGITASNGTAESYVFDGIGNLSAKTVAAGVWNYSYDGANRLLSETLTNAGGDILDSRVYTYDAAGNRLSSAINGVSVSRSYNELNQDTAFVYDAAGNLLNDTVRTYTWTADNRVLSETLISTGESWVYTYDAFGNRDTVTAADGRKTVYTCGPDGTLYAGVSSDGTARTYVLGGDGLIAGFLDENGDAYYFTTDRLGSVISVSNSSGEVCNTYSYDAWGNVIASTVTVGNDLTYLGAYGVVANASGTYYIQARNYDPATGRWLSEDSAGAAVSPNLYSYCRDNALAYLDVTGNNALTMFQRIEKINEVYQQVSGYQEKFETVQGYGDTLNSWAADYYSNHGEISTRMSRDAFIDVVTTVGGAAAPTGGDMISETGGFVKRLASGIEYKTLPFSSHPATGAMQVEFLNHDLYNMAQLLADAQTPEEVKNIVDFTNYMLERGITDDAKIKELYEKMSALSGSMDPNDKLVNVGFGEAGYVVENQCFTYTVRFENDPVTATSPVRWLRVYDTLDENLDLDTFTLTSFSLAGNLFTVGDGRSSCNERITVSIGGISVLVDAAVNLDRETRQLSAVFTAIDPETGAMLQNIDLGFLYPNDDSGRGDGQIVYSVAAKNGLANGTVITNTADIYFDFNDPIATPSVSNTIDATLPVVTSFEGVTTNLSWSGSDTGSGVGGYDVEYRLSGDENWSRWLSGTKLTSGIFIAEGLYEFRLRAIDNAGNIGEWSGVYEHNTTLKFTDFYGKTNDDGDCSLNANGIRVKEIIASAQSDVAGNITALIALNANASPCNIYGGGNNVNVGGKIAMTVSTGGYSGVVYGGSRAYAKNVTVHDIAVSVGGIVHSDNQKLIAAGKGNSAWIVGGGVADNAQTLTAGAVNITLDGANVIRVVGGAQAQNAGSTATVESVNITVRNSTLAGDLFGGGYAYNGGTSVVSGGTFITIDTTAANVTVMGNIYGGGANPSYYSKGGSTPVNGGSTVTFTGLGEKLTVGTVSGDGMIAGMVSGVRTLEFRDFFGEISANVKNFDLLKFAGTSEITAGPGYGANTFKFDLTGRDASYQDVAFIQNASAFTFADGDKLLQVELGATSGNYDLMAVDDAAMLDGLKVELFKNDALLCSFNYGETKDGYALAFNNGMLSVTQK
ncbi:MAG: Ig-like domain-containing protein [Victivallaceae bacterium]|nr:Ig-like domain-containing protein [Victivallaceae bacterium]